jgi:hypothetical protein
MISIVVLVFAVQHVCPQSDFSFPGKFEPRPIFTKKEAIRAVEEQMSEPKHPVHLASVTAQRFEDEWVLGQADGHSQIHLNQKDGRIRCVLAVD